jgi:hypothetical protein
MYTTNSDDSFSEIFGRYDGEFKEIDRKKENEMIVEFQNSGDLSILQEIYIGRIQTLKVWAIKNYYPNLAPSIDDFMEELTLVFLNAANKYNPEKGSFNTCLYTFLSNRIKNMKNASHAKKRRPERKTVESGEIFVSVDSHYHDSKSGRNIRMGDVLSRKKNDDHSNFSKDLSFSDTVSILAGDDETLRSVFVRLGEGESFSSIIRGMKKKEGDISLSKREIASLRESGFSNLKDLIVNNVDVDNLNFNILDYSLDGSGTLKYSIEFKSTDKIKMVRRKINDMRERREHFLNKVNTL